MGVDIHMVVEVRKNNAWACNSDPVFPDWHDNLTHVPVYGRNYELFNILTDKSDEYKPLGAHYGFPADMGRAAYIELSGDFEDSDKDLEAFVKEATYDYHWITYAELAAYDWAPNAPVGVFMTPVQYEKYLNTGNCDWYIDPRDVKGNYTWIEADDYVKSAKEDLVLIDLEMRDPTFNDVTYSFVKDVLNPMETLARRYGDDNVRLIYCFDC